MAIMRDQPQAVSELNPEMPGEFDRLVERCLEKDPDCRIQKVRDVCTEPKAIKEASDSGSRRPAGTPAGSRQRRVAVLPFANLSTDPEQEYFSQSL